MSQACEEANMNLSPQKFSFNPKSYLSREEQRLVQNTCIDGELPHGITDIISEVCRTIGIGVPTVSDLEMASKIVVALPAERIPKTAPLNSFNGIWLLTESFLLQGKDPGIIERGASNALLMAGMFNEWPGIRNL